MSLEIAVIAGMTGLVFTFAYLSSVTKKEYFQILFLLFSMIFAVVDIMLMAELAQVGGAPYTSVWNILDMMFVPTFWGFFTVLALIIIAYLKSLFDAVIKK